MSHTKESAELKHARNEYLKKLTTYGGLPMPATAHYTAGYKDGSAILADVAQTCAEAERRVLSAEKQHDDLLAALDGAANYIDRLGGDSGTYRIAIACVKGGA